jgi:hypothetical protein
MFSELSQGELPCLAEGQELAFEKSLIKQE